MATLMERLAFLKNVPILMKATADDEMPCPGYLFEEIGKISHESVGWSQCLLEYLLDRLQGDSCHVKLKVLKILSHLSRHGPPHLLTELRRNATFIQEVAVYSGPPDPLHGSSPYRRVRSAAQDLGCQLFTDTVLPQTVPSPAPNTAPALGMGSESVIRSGMQGFGYSPRKHTSGGGSLLGRIQQAAEVVASAVLPPTEQQGIRLHDNHYRAVLAPSAAVEVAVPACAESLPSHGLRAACRCPGRVGGGWEESDSGHTSHDSSQENGNTSRASGTDSQSGASRESGELSERPDSVHRGDCCLETMLIGSLTDGSKVFLSKEESQHFIKECPILNCEVVLELLCRKLQDPSHTVQMRALSAIASLMLSDLLSLDHMFMVTHEPLGQLSRGPPGPAANKATKLLRQFEALMGEPVGVSRVGVVRGGPVLLDSSPRPVEQGIFLTTASRGSSSSSDQGEASKLESACLTPPSSGSGVGSGLVSTETTTETPGHNHGDEDCKRLGESLFSGMELLRPRDTPSAMDRGATGTLTDRGATPTLADRGATPTLADRGATGTLTDKGATGTLTDRGATPTLADRGATPTLADRGATPTLADRGATPTLADRGATPTLTDRGATPTLEDRGATPTLADRGSMLFFVDRGTDAESEADLDSQRETRPPQAPPPCDPLNTGQQHSAFSFLNT